MASLAVALADLARLSINPLIHNPMQIIDQAAIDARNELNRTADRVEAELQALMAAHKDKKVWKISRWGGLTSAVAKKLATIEAELPPRHRLTIRSEVSGIWAELQLRYERPEGGVHYCKESFRVGRRDDDGVMTEADTPAYPDGRPQFVLADVKAAADRAYQLESEARELRSSIACFNR